VPVTRRKLPAVETADKPVLTPIPFPNQRQLTVRQAAVYLACSVWAVRDLLRREELRKIKLGKKFLIDRMDLDRFIERMKTAA